MTDRAHRSAGFTLIEAIVIIVVAGIALAPIAALFVEGVQEAVVNERITVAVGLAEDLLEEIRARKFDEGTPDGGGTIQTADATIGLDGEAPRRAFDDVDDYHGLSETPPEDADGTAYAGVDVAAYTRSVQVVFVNAGAPDTPVAGPTDLKRIEVQVSWNGGTSSVRLYTLAGNGQ